MKTKEYNEQVDKYNTEVETKNKSGLRLTKVGHWIVVVLAYILLLFGNGVLTSETSVTSKIAGGLLLMIGLFVIIGYVEKGINSIFQSSKESNSS